MILEPFVETAQEIEVGRQRLDARTTDLLAFFFQKVYCEPPRRLRRRAAVAETDSSPSRAKPRDASSEGRRETHGTGSRLPRGRS